MADPDWPICSARECSNPAYWAILWRNPKIHQSREKTWMACESHKERLQKFVALRDFPNRVVPAVEVVQDQDTLEANPGSAQAKL